MNHDTKLISALLINNIITFNNQSPKLLSFQAAWHPSAPRPASRQRRAPRRTPSGERNPTRRPRRRGREDSAPDLLGKEKIVIGVAVVRMVWISNLWCWMHLWRSARKASVHLLIAARRKCTLLLATWRVKTLEPSELPLKNNLFLQSQAESSKPLDLKGPLWRGNAGQALTCAPQYSLTCAPFY